jgi:hypothetical protein
MLELPAAQTHQRADIHPRRTGLGWFPLHGRSTTDPDHPCIKRSVRVAPNGHKLFVTACYSHRRRPTVLWIASRVTESKPASGRRLGRTLTCQDLRSSEALPSVPSKLFRTSDKGLLVGRLAPSLAPGDLVSSANVRMIRIPCRPMREYSCDLTRLRWEASGRTVPRSALPGVHTPTTPGNARS